MLREEIRDRPWDSWVRWRLARAFDLMEMPESALVHAGAAWEARPQEERFLAEYFKALRRTGHPDEVLELADLVRNGGSARYYAAACGHAPSMTFLEDSIFSSNDSTAADACCWLSVLVRSEGDSARALELLGRSVELSPGEHFYRAMLIEDLCDAGLLEEARGNLLLLRRNRWFEQPYWSACAAVARLEGDDERLLWALRRAVEARRIPETVRSLGWGLVSAACRDLREGRLEHAVQRLEEAVSLGAEDERFTAVSDSLLAMTAEYHE